VIERSRTGERAVLVRLGLGAPIDPEDLEEFTQLATSAGAVPVATITGRRARPDSKFFVGSGKADELRDAAVATDADLILIDHALSPSQERNLEEHTGRRVLDRNGLILDIFAQRARSLEGKLEVELAQLKHLASRLVRGWTHLERQKGGIGMRGPGETQLETDRRLLGQRVKVLGKRLERIQLQRETGRRTRMQIPIPTLALVGYTNAGKSTLFSALTGAPAYVADQLFATLDPTVRRIRLPGGTPAVVADTVGFIRDLPHELVAAFRSTLTEAREATVLLHVVDASDPRRAERIEQVDAVLAEIDAGEIPQILVYNKIDRLQTAPRIERDADGRVASVWICAAQSVGIPLLADAITERIARTVHASRVRIPPSAGQLRSRLYARGVVKQEIVLEDGHMELLLELPTVDLLELARAPGVIVIEAPGSGAPCTPAPGYLQSAPPASAAKLS
jgi:GTP-binding protein HflX